MVKERLFGIAVNIFVSSNKPVNLREQHLTTTIMPPLQLLGNK